ncbi:MAG: IS1/IS1595 family N-terminal zinc-binding domain-containing protein, partial [Terriglobia bacterium]
EAIMTTLSCKGCGASDYVKNGRVRGLQRYRCKACACNFTATPPRGKHPAMKALTLLLCAMGNMSYRMIGRTSRKTMPLPSRYSYLSVANTLNINDSSLSVEASSGANAVFHGDRRRLRARTGIVDAVWNGRA